MKQSQIILIALVGGAALYLMSKPASAASGDGSDSGLGSGRINIRVGIPGGTLYINGEQKAVVPANGVAALTLPAPYEHTAKVEFPDGKTTELLIQVYEGSNPDRLIKHPDDVAGGFYYKTKADEAIASGNTAEADAQTAFAAANQSAANKQYANALSLWQTIVDANNSSLVNAAKLAIQILQMQLRTGQKVEGVK